MKRNNKVGPTKGRRRRAVDIDPELAEALKVWIQALRLSGRDFVFPSRQTDHSKAVTYMWFYREFNLCRKAAEEAGHLPGAHRPVKIHDLRHSHASWLLALGVPVWDVSRRLGHRNTKVTEETYGHLGQHGRENVRVLLPGLRSNNDVVKYSATSRPPAALYALTTNGGGVSQIDSDEELDAAGF